MKIYSLKFGFKMLARTHTFSTFNSITQTYIFTPFPKTEIGIKFKYSSRGSLPLPPPTLKLHNWNDGNIGLVSRENSINLCEIEVWSIIKSLIGLEESGRKFNIPQLPWFPTQNLCAIKLARQKNEKKRCVKAIH